MQIEGKPPISDLAARVERGLRELIGLQIFKSWNVFATRYFYFAPPGLQDKTQDGDYWLMIECAWRVEGHRRILVGSNDYGIAAIGNTDPNWNPMETQRGHLQDERLGEIFGEIREGSIYNTASLLVVESVAADEFGGFRLGLSGGYFLAVFPTSVNDIEWLLSRREGGNLALDRGGVCEGKGADLRNRQGAKAEQQRSVSDPGPDSQ